MPLLMIAAVIATALVTSAPTSARVDNAAIGVPQVCDSPDKSITLFGERLGTNRIGYGFSPATARIPGPTLSMMEGECLEVTLVNHTEKRLSIHAHGVDYTVASDGTRLNSSCVLPGRSLTYVFAAHRSFKRPDGTINPGSAGYWHYHDHCRGSAHGTRGINSGAFGAFIVRREGDPLPERKPFVVVMGPGMTINLRRAPNTPTFEANLGERVEFVVIGHGDLFHTFHLHGHRWVDNRTGMPASTTDSSQIIDNRTVGPADSFGFQVVAGEHVGPGAWMYHCHVQSHAELGMAGMFMVHGADGQLSRRSASVLRAWRQGHSAEHHAR